MDNTLVKLQKLSEELSTEEKLYSEAIIDNKDFEEVKQLSLNIKRLHSTFDMTYQELVS